ncbi:DUF1289 domain-containing protein [Vibrio profundum]|uniref:DUF1289 domain-containing protein n=1 Tax=Vibrio profundum TaxID=2910247 RepID=UPI003D0B7388
MEQLEFFVVPSPCIGVCTVDDKGYCNGCMRKREERFTWLQMTPTEQLHVINLCRQRYRRKMAKKKANVSQYKDDSDPQQTLF